MPHGASGIASAEEIVAAIATPYSSTKLSEAVVTW
jgi:hypothetical protein